jgi:hypothetical protein
MAFLNIKIPKGEKSVGEVLRSIGEHAFLATVLLTALSAILAAFLYYQYVVAVPKNAGARTFEFEFQEKLFQNVLDGLDKEQQRLEAVDALSPRDIFNP